MIVSLLALGVAGFLLSLYGYLVEQKIKQNPLYKPVCDLSDKVSCSKPILSEYGQLFFLSNTVVGMIFYAAVMLFSLLGLGQLVFILACSSLGASLILAYLLYFKIRSFCLICTAIYLINIALFVISFGYRC